MTPEELDKLTGSCSDDEFEPGVCVACKAESDTVFDPGGINAPCCFECKDDGSFQNWLASELEKVMASSGYTSRTTEDGRTLWTPPKEETPNL